MLNAEFRTSKIYNVFLWREGRKNSLEHTTAKDLHDIPECFNEPMIQNMRIRLPGILLDIEPHHGCCGGTWFQW